jgi:MFS family permease
VPGPVKGLAAVSLLNDFASEMVYPLLPKLVTGPLGAGALALGAIDGAADLAAALLRSWSGRRSDRPGWRSPLIAVGYGLATVVRPAIAVAAAAWQVVGLRVLDRVGKGLRSPARDALIADITPEERHGQAYGLHRAADHLGAVLGALAGFALLEAGLSISQVIGASLLPGLVALVVLGLVLRAARDPSSAADPRPVPVPSASPSRAPGVALGTLALIAAARLPETLLLLRLQDLGLSVAATALLWAVLHVVRSGSAYPAGLLADRLGARVVLGIGSLGYAAGLVGLARAQVLDAGVVVFLALGIATGLVEPAERVAVAAVGGSKRGRAFGTYQAMVGVASLAVALLLGWVYQARGGPVALVAAAGLAAGSLLVWLLLAPKPPSPQAPKPPKP